MRETSAASQPVHRTPSVAAVVVTFNPDIADLRATFASVAPQVGHLISVDNASANVEAIRDACAKANAEFVPLTENFGIAHAQNEGLKRALTLPVDYLLLLDQDSRAAPGMVDALVNVALMKASEGYKIAAVGPRYIDPRQDNPEPFIELQGMRLVRKRCGAACAVTVDYLIASGSLIPTAAIEAVGDMRAELFIDYVDIEWGLRAKAKGFQSFGACEAAMHHSLGDAPVRFGKRVIPVHSALRYYYHFRNAIWLYRQGWLDGTWKMVDAMRLFRKFVFYSVVTAPRLHNCRMMLLGVMHGLTGRMGRLDNVPGGSRRI